MANHSSGSGSSGSSNSSSSRPRCNNIYTPSSSSSSSNSNSRPHIINKTRSLTSMSTLSEDKDHQAIWVNPLKTPSFPEGSGHCSLTHGIRIEAPVALVLSVLIDTRYYHQWNPFCPQLPIHEQPRMTAPIPSCVANDPAISSIAHLPTTLRDACRFTMPVYLDTQGLPDESSPAASATRGSKSVARSFKVTALESFALNDRTGIRVAWRLCSKVTQYILRSERVYELVASPDDPNATDLLVWETFHGPLAPTIKATYHRKLERGCVTWNEGMKRHAESRAQGIRGMAKEVLDVREPVLEEDEEQES